MIGEKACARCEQEKPVDDFYKDSSKKSGYCSYCKDCARSNHLQWSRENRDHINAKNKAWRDANPEKSAAFTRSWQERHPEQLKATSQKWRASNRELVNRFARESYRRNVERRLPQQRAYKEANRERLAEVARAYWRENQDLARFHKAKRRATKQRATPPWANLEEVRRIYELAAQLSFQLGLAIEVDHIVPLQSTLVCGLHWEGNLQLITAEKNHRKGNRYWPDMP